MMDVFLALGAVLLATTVGFYSWQKSIAAQVGYLALALLVTAAMVAIRLALTESGVGFVSAMTEPPYWKLLVVLLADVAILISISAKLLAVVTTKLQKRRGRR